MATFHFSNDHVIDLDFCEQYHKRLELDTVLMQRFKTASEYLTGKDGEIKNTTDPAVLDTMCDYVMDAIDMILGDGEADKILGLKGNYSVFDAIDVANYIFNEITAKINSMAKTNNAPVADTVPHMNRAQRRAEMRRLVSTHTGHEHYESLS